MSKDLEGDTRYVKDLETVDEVRDDVDKLGEEI